MISMQETEVFLLHQLKFKNWEEILQKDKLIFIQLLVKHYAHNIYFQNVSMSAIEEEERKVPDEYAIIKAGLKGMGGNCFVQNSFLMLLLKALGFDAYIISGMFKGPGCLPDNHVMCVVRFNVNELYLLDLGSTLPFAEPVPLHNLPYTNRAAGYRYLFRKSDNGIYERVQLDGSFYGEKYENADTEYVRYDFTLEPRTIEFFKEPLKDIFTDPTKSSFLQHSMLFRYFHENAKGEMQDDVQISGNRKFIQIRGVSILIADDDTKVVKHMSCYNDTKEVILKYFPKLKAEDVDKSLECFNKNLKNDYFRES